MSIRGFAVAFVLIASAAALLLGAEKRTRGTEGVWQEVTIWNETLDMKSVKNAEPSYWKFGVQREIPVEYMGSATVSERDQCGLSAVCLKKLRAAAPENPSH